MLLSPRNYYEEGGDGMSEQKIIQGDCLEVMRGFPDKHFDLVLTDPPYGIGAANGIGGGSSRGAVNKFEGDWDNAIPGKEYFDEMRRVSKEQIIFGGNYFTEHLPPTASWFIWDKREGLPERTFADCEMAWVSEGSPARIFRFRWDGMIQEDMKNKEVKYHPTLKPVELMKWCLSRFPETTSVLDPFMGSGTTLVAAKQLGISATGIEISEKYCEVAKNRLSQDTLL